MVGSLNAVSLVVVPLFVCCWIFTTIRATHLIGVRFWFIPSIYVGLIGGILAPLVSLTMFAFSEEAERRGHKVTDTTLYVAAAILYCGCVVWSYFYNWRKTGSALLSVSLTLLQTISAAFVIVALYLWISGHNTKQYEREHGINRVSVRDGPQGRVLAGLQPRHWPRICPRPLPSCFWNGRITKQCAP
jgi:hypothetical protein